MKFTGMTSRALKIEGSRLEQQPDGTTAVVVSLRLRRFWAPFFAADITPWWWAKPFVFISVAWAFWVLRR